MTEAGTKRDSVGCRIEAEKVFRCKAKRVDIMKMLKIKRNRLKMKKMHPIVYRPLNRRSSGIEYLIAT